LRARKVAASHDIGTRMVIEAQTEISALVPQNSGGPVKVTKMQAASDSNISDSPRRSLSLSERRTAIPICSIVKTPVQMHSNPIIEVEKNEILMSIKAL
jgi:hypothetical protein